jgi:hypothetical protein
MTSRQVPAIVAALLFSSGLIFYLSLSSEALARGNKASDSEPANGASANDAAEAASAFESMVPVLHHPRCMNCHSRGDFPRQGDDSHRHTMNVPRGVAGDGVSALKCSTCHQDHNLEGMHTPPGAPDWHLPPPGMPMIWEGRTDRELCELFKDPKQNGNRNMEQIVEHMSTPLVLWGWHPGEGRTPIPVPQSDFIVSVKKWAANGAGCPSSANSSARPASAKPAAGVNK